MEMVRFAIDKSYGLERCCFYGKGAKLVEQIYGGRIEKITNFLELPLADLPKIKQQMHKHGYNLQDVTLGTLLFDFGYEGY